MLFDVALFSLYLFPGLLIPRLQTESGALYLSTRVLASVFVNGSLALIALRGGWHTVSFWSWYVSVGVFIIILAAVIFRNRLCQFVLELWSSRYLFGLLLLLFSVWSYWTSQFPVFPTEVDTLRYHLPVPRLLAGGDIFRDILLQESRLSLILQGSYGFLIVEYFHSIFLFFNSGAFKLSPPLFGCLLVCGTFGLTHRVTASRVHAAFAVALLLMIPVTLRFGSTFKAEMLLAACLVHLFAQLPRGAAAPVAAQIIRVLLLVSLSSLALLEKKTALVILPLLALIGIDRMRCSAAEELKAGKLVLITLGIVCVVTAPYLISLPDLPQFPGRPGLPSFSVAVDVIYHGFITHLLGSARFTNPAILLACIVVTAACTFLVRGIRWSYLERCMLYAAGMWLIFVAVGLLFMNNPSLAQFTGRFIYPICPLLCVLIVSQCRTLSVTFAGRASGVSKRWIFSGIVGVILICSLTVAGWWGVRRYLLNRSGTLGYAHAAPWQSKMRRLYGDTYAAWEYINRGYEDHVVGRVATIDLRVHYIDPPVVELPPYPALNQSRWFRVRRDLLMWLHRHNVRWVVLGSYAPAGNSALANQISTIEGRIEKVLQDSLIGEKAEFGQVRVYTLYH